MALGNKSQWILDFSFNPKSVLESLEGRTSIPPSFRKIQKYLISIDY